MSPNRGLPTVRPLDSTDRKVEDDGSFRIIDFSPGRDSIESLPIAEQPQPSAVRQKLQQYLNMTRNNFVKCVRRKKEKELLHGLISRPDSERYGSIENNSQ